MQLCSVLILLFPSTNGHLSTRATFYGVGETEDSPYIDSPQSGRCEEVQLKYITIEIRNT